MFNGRFLITTLLLLLPGLLVAQTPPQRTTNRVQLHQLEQKFRRQAEQDRAQIPPHLVKRFTLPDETITEVQSIQNGVPVYYQTENWYAAITTRTDYLWEGDFEVSGAGLEVGIWDSGIVRRTHREFGERITAGDDGFEPDPHATYVAGTMIAAGIRQQAHGMAYQADMISYDWNTDAAEMAAEAADGMLVSNHSYGVAAGWYLNYFGDMLWAWHGDLSISTEEDYKFGFYSERARDWDEIAYNAPFYLIVISASNHRSDAGPEHPDTTAHWVFDPAEQEWVLATGYRIRDGGEFGFDCMPSMKNAKNILTVGAVRDVIDYAGPESVLMSWFSSYGPTDDGRIKPDLVANGVNLYTTGPASDFSYGSKSGTSLAAPNASGTLALLQQHYQQTHEGASMRSATLKALAIHTADECGTADGPDYAFGWGLLNAQRAGYLITTDVTHESIHEWSLLNGTVDEFTLESNGEEPLRVTLCWTDPPGTPVAPALNPPDRMLVNDLDLRVEYEGETFYPWVLDPQNPLAPAITGDNIRDNVEQIWLSTPIAGTYTIRVSHKNELAGGSQDYSLIISGQAIERYTIDGRVLYREGQQRLSNVRLQLGALYRRTTRSTGLFVLNDIPAANYQLVPSKTDGVNGISVFDAARVAQFAIGVIEFDGHQQLAADVSGDGEVTAYDAALIARYAIGLESESRTGTWAFQPPQYDYLPLDADQPDQDFTGILYGEVTGNWTP